MQEWTLTELHAFGESLAAGRDLRKAKRVLATCAIVRGTPQNEAGRLVVQHKADPETSTFTRKDEAYGKS